MCMSMHGCGCPTRAETVSWCPMSVNVVFSRYELIESVESDRFSGHVVICEFTIHFALHGLIPTDAEIMMSPLLKSRTLVPLFRKTRLRLFIFDFLLLFFKFVKCISSHFSHDLSIGFCFICRLILPSKHRSV